MRNLSLYLVILLISLPSFAQQPPQTRVDSMLTQIDKSQFTSHFLYDRTLAWSGLDTFNSKQNLASTSYFEQAYIELRNAANDSIWMPKEMLCQEYIPDSIQNKVKLGVLNVTFNSLNYNETDENLGGLKLSNDTFEPLKNGNDLFNEHHALVIAPTQTYLKGSTIEYQLDNNLIFQKADGKEMVSLTANFETANDYVLIENKLVIQPTITINYTEFGYKTLTFTAVFEDGSSVTTQSVVHVKTISPLPEGTFEDTFVSTIPFQGYDEPNPILGEIFYRVYYGNEQNKILKPLIIIDGFDPGDKRKIEDADSNLPNDEHVSILEMMSYQRSSGEVIPLLPILKRKGYDVIVVNHIDYVRNGNLIDGGADFIERNALTHASFYQYLNAELVQNNSTEELVIIGPSMGGQISRYALSYLEKEGIDHNTRLWISIDSPHLGANINMGLQSLLNQMKNDVSAAQDFVENQLGSPAAKQQLIEQFHSFTGNNVSQNFLNAKTVSQGFSESRGHLFFKTYYDNLFSNGLPNSLGYPQNTRNIAIANGSLTGNRNFKNPWDNNSTDTYLQPGNIGLNARAFQNPFNLHVSSLEAYAVPPPGNYSKVSRFKKAWTDNSKHLSNLNSRGCLDNTPGGWFPGFQELANPIEGSSAIPTGGSFWSSWSSPFSNILSTLSWILGGADFTLYDNKRVHSFIPVISALGFKDPDLFWTQNLNRDLVCSNEIPFDSYYGPKLNERHTSFTLESVTWLLKEIDGRPQPPTVYYEGDDIDGPAAICNSDIVTYTIPSNCGLIPEQWEVSSNLEIVTISLDNSTITVAPRHQNIQEAAYLKAIYSHGEVQKNIWIGIPLSPTYLNGPIAVHTASMQTYSGGGSVGAESYKWVLPYPFDPLVDITNPINFNSDNWQMWPTNTGYNSHVFTGNGGHDGLIQLIAVNSCGEGGSIHLYVTHDNSGPCTTCYDPVLPYPNFADDQFTLDFSNHPDQTYLIFIYSQYGEMVYEGSSNNIEKTIDTLTLPNGTYFLHIHENDNVTMKQLIVQH